MKKKIQFSLVYRDMWQSSGKFQPRKDQLAKIAPVIIEMGCFSRVETNGGAFEQVNLLAGENPNDAVRAFCKPFNEVGIKTHMLDRGLNALRMYPVPDDVRALMYKVKAKQGTNITRIFDGLNDVRNIIPSIKWAKEGGMTPQCALCITNSPVHTLDYYMNIADQLIAAGAEEICLKDMAGIGQPAFLGKLTKMIKDKYPEIIIQYHGHSGPGLSMASILEVCNNGADIIDTAIEPLSWGKVHPDVISVISMLKNEGFEVPEINMSAYMKARAMTQEFIDEWLGYFINPGNKIMSSLLLGCGLPGGMMGSMMADLGGMRQTINNIRKKKGEEVNAISSVNMYQTSAVHSVNAVQMGTLSEETIRKLKELGIDPNTVKNEAEAQALIAQAQKAKQNNNGEKVQGKTDIQIQSMKKKSEDLGKKMEDLAEKLGITLSKTDSAKVSIEKLEQSVKAVAEPNQMNKVGAITDKKIDEKPENLKADLQDIKITYDDVERAKNTAFAGQDMMAMLNKMALGIS